MKVRLGDIATTITKGTTPTTLGFNYVNCGINFVKVESITEDGEFLRDSFAYINDECNLKLRRSQLQENDLLFSIAGAIGRVAVVDKSILPANTNQALAIIRIPEGLINYKFLYYALISPIVSKQYEKLKQGIAQLNLSLKDIGNFQIPKLCLKEQSNIVKVLDIVSDIIRKRKEQIKKLDLLVKSKFIEMFGDPKRASRIYPTVPITDIARELFAGGDKPTDNLPEQDEAYRFPVYSNGERNKGLLCYSRSYRVDKEAITVSARGAIGYSVIRNPYFTPVVRLLTLVPNESINIIYLKVSLDFLELHGTGSSQEQLTLPEFKKFSIILPPLDLQNEFAHFVEQVDKLKLKIKRSLEKLETLKKALMQKYFG